MTRLAGRLLMLVMLIGVGLTGDAKQKLVPCNPGRDRACVPPKEFRYVAAPVPFDCPVTFSRAAGDQWYWKKAGEPSRPCTGGDTAKGREYSEACNKRVGQEIYITHAFTIEEN